jgi:hypothetical protein
MQTIEVLDIKPFMQLLFQTTHLDNYELVSATIRTDMTYELDGHINKDFFSEEEMSLMGENPVYLSWHTAKEKVFGVIKGKKTPSILKVVLKLSQQDTAKLLENSNSAFQSRDIDGLFVNILFQEGKLSVVCGISYKIFTMDKNLENEFTENIHALLKACGITCQ